MEDNIEEQIDWLCTIVESQYGVDREVFLAKNRKREYVNFRRILMVILKKHTDESLASIGAHMRGKDHATVLHAIRTHEQLMVGSQKTKMPVNKEYADLFATIYSEYLSTIDNTFDKVALRNVLMVKIETMKNQVATIDKQLEELNSYKQAAAEVEE